MRWLVFFFIVANSIAATGQIPPHADGSPSADGAIIGTVMEKFHNHAEPISGVIVSIDNGRIFTHTDELGTFKITPLPPDTYDVCFEHHRYFCDTLFSVVVKPEKEIYVDEIMLSINFHDASHITNKPYNRNAAIAIGVTQAVLTTGTLVVLNQIWYKQYPRESFHTFNDNAEWLQMDKLGHLQSSYSIGQIATSLWDLSHIKHEKAVWIGGLTGVTYLTAVEVMDGFSSGWGFSTGDMIANVGGAALFISQELCWREQRVMPKFGFERTKYAAMRPEILGGTRNEQIIKDYNGQTYWLSVNVASFLNRETKFPRWLNVAFGYGANGMTGGHANPVMYNSAGNEITVERYRQYYFSLDIDLRRIPTRSRFLRVLFNTINFIKIPAPAIEVNKFGVRGHVLKF